MQFDPAKDAANTTKHGISLAAVNTLQAQFVVEDLKHSQDERRFTSTAESASACGSPASRGATVTSARSACAPPIERNECSMPRKSKPQDDDARVLSRAEFDRGVLIGDGPTALEAHIDAATKARGKQKAPTKQLVSLRLSREVLASYKSTGRGWQSRIDRDLLKLAPRVAREAAKSHR